MYALLYGVVVIVADVFNSVILLNTSWSGFTY